MTLLAAIILVAYGLAFIGFTGVVFVAPARAKRFLGLFASSARAHYVEMAFRLLLGASLIVLSPTIWPANIVRVIGWAIVLSSTVLLLMPWQWHHRIGNRVLPTLVRRMRLYAVGVFVVGCLLLYVVFVSGTGGRP